MTRSFRVVALLLLAGYALAASSICPPQRTPASAGASNRVAGAHAQTGELLSHAEHASHGPAASIAAEHAPCHEVATPVELRAPCPCGCGDRAEPAGAPMGLGPGLVSRAGLLVPNPGTAALLACTSALPAPLPAAIDHVPLAA